MRDFGPRINVQQPMQDAWQPEPLPGTPGSAAQAKAIAERQVGGGVGVNEAQRQRDRLGKIENQAVRIQTLQIDSMKTNLEYKARQREEAANSFGGKLDRLGKKIAEGFEKAFSWDTAAGVVETYAGKGAADTFKGFNPDVENLNVNVQLPDFGERVEQKIRQRESLEKDLRQSAEQTRRTVGTAAAYPVYEKPRELSFLTSSSKGGREENEEYGEH